MEYGVMTPSIWMDVSIANRIMPAIVHTAAAPTMITPKSEFSCLTDKRSLTVMAIEESENRMATKKVSYGESESNGPRRSPKINGTIEVMRPVTSICLPADRNIFWFISRPVMKRRRMTPILPKNWMMGFISMKFNSCLLYTSPSPRD